MPILIDSGMPPSHREALELIVPTGTDIIEIAPFATACVRRLWLAPSQMYMPVLEELNERFKWEHFLAPPARFAAIIREMDKMLSASTRHEDCVERLFLARQEFRHRKLTNHLMIEGVSQARGFQIIYPETLSFSEQIKLIRNARYVVAPNGSAAMLAFFARPGTKVCILSHPNTIADLDFFAVLAELDITISVFSGSYVRHHDEWPHFADYEIDEVEYARFLKDWLDAESP